MALDNILLLDQETHLSLQTSFCRWRQVASRVFTTLANQDTIPLSSNNTSFLNLNCQVVHLALLNFWMILKMLVPVLKKWRKHHFLWSQPYSIQEPSKPQSVSLAKDVNWLCIWEAARDKGSYWARTSQKILSFLWLPLVIITPIDIDTLLSDLNSSDSEPSTSIFHAMRSIVTAYCDFLSVSSSYVM